MVRLSIRFITSMFALILCLGCFQLPLEQRAKGPFDAVYEWHDDVMKVTVFNMSDEDCLIRRQNFSVLCSGDAQVERRMGDILRTSVVPFSSGVSSDVDVDYLPFPGRMSRQSSESPAGATVEMKAPRTDGDVVRVEVRVCVLPVSSFEGVGYCQELHLRSNAAHVNVVARKKGSEGVNGSHGCGSTRKGGAADDCLVDAFYRLRDDVMEIEIRNVSEQEYLVLMHGRSPLSGLRIEYEDARVGEAHRFWQMPQCRSDEEVCYRPMEGGEPNVWSPYSSVFSSVKLPSEVGRIVGVEASVSLLPLSNLKGLDSCNRLLERVQEQTVTVRASKSGKFLPGVQSYGIKKASEDCDVDF